MSGTFRRPLGRHTEAGASPSWSAEARHSLVFEDKDGIRAGWACCWFVLLFVGFEILTGRRCGTFFPEAHVQRLMPVRLGLIMEVAQLAPLFLGRESWP